ncbi:MAG: TIGR02186 family protein [Proteobacteria bacterium]|nr:TIGR02186 family protein [Pseudomonadota bacterium]MBU1714820.1 TIGR02186 family protein [Pseudomonadota bacterium]
MIKNILITISLVLTALISLPQTGSAAEISLNIAPTTVEITTFYNGSTIEVKGDVAADAEVLVLVSGSGEELHVKKKGKVGGLFWMNVGDMTFENVPRVYMIYTGKELADKLENKSMGLGFNALEGVVEIKPESEDNSFYFKEFVRLKESQGLYSKSGEAVTYGATSNGVRSFQATLTIPPQMKQDSYTVAAYAVKDNHVLANSTAKLELKMVSFPAQLSRLAFNHSLMYGIMAVIIAILAGLIISAIFKSKGDGAH